MKLLRLCHSMAVPFAIHLRRPPFPLHCPILLFPSNHFLLSASVHRQTITSAISFSTCNHQPSPSSDFADDFPSKQVSELFFNPIDMIYLFIDVDGLLALFLILGLMMIEMKSVIILYSTARIPCYKSIMLTYNR